MNTQLEITDRIKKTPAAFKKLLLHNLYHTHGQALQVATKHDAYMTLSYTVRDYLIERCRRTIEARFKANAKNVYYLSAEFLLGKQLEQNLLYSDTTKLAQKAATDFDLDLEELLEIDVEPGLGNGGLGRLAACFIDSLATLDIPAVGYGIRYEFGIFKQTFRDGWQIEKPDAWAQRGNPWEFAQPDDMVEVGFWGQTETYLGDDGNVRSRWVPEKKVLGEPCTTLVPGYGTETVNILRLWRARATDDFDFELFDTGDYARAVEQKVFSENISKVLYPNDNNYKGKQLRLQQQYFFVTCSLRDIIRRFFLMNDDWDQFPEKAVIQLNDTHPVVAIPELMRILVDETELDWDHAWTITSKTFAYTCHTLLPEALETWSVDLFQSLLPRHLEIIYEINRRFLMQVRERFPNDDARVSRMSIIGEDAERTVRMANLATVASFSVNGVAELQSRLLKERTLRDFSEMWPSKFQNKTNGVTPRRFMRLANPQLSDLITSTIGDGWLRDLDLLSQLEEHVDDPVFCEAWKKIKQQNKQKLTSIIAKTSGIDLNPDAIFDIMVKRLHEYKRQLLKVMHIIWLYQRVKQDPTKIIAPRAFVFGAKAAPGYFMAKLIIKLIHNVADVINHDPDVAGLINIAFPANFNVSLAENIYPAANISEQISMAGKEASGTGNMKFTLNGALTVGTLDGANVEIRERVGAENFFLFGLTTDQVFDLKGSGYNPRDHYHRNAGLKNVIDSISSGVFSAGDFDLFRPIVDSLLDRDDYLLLADFQSYVECSERAAAAYTDQQSWTRMSILNTARCGFFSSDRSMREYCEQIWDVKPVKI